MKNKKTILAIAAGLLALFLVFAWLFWGAKVPEPTDPAKPPEATGPKAAVHDTVLHRDEKGKRLWEMKVGEAVQMHDDLIQAKNLEGTLYLSNGDEMKQRLYPERKRHRTLKTGRVPESGQSGMEAERRHHHSFRRGQSDQRRHAGHRGTNYYFQ